MTSQTESKFTCILTCEFWFRFTFIQPTSLRKEIYIFFINSANLFMNRVLIWNLPQICSRTWIIFHPANCCITVASHFTLRTGVQTKNILPSAFNLDSYTIWLSKIQSKKITHIRLQYEIWLISLDFFPSLIYHSHFVDTDVYFLNGWFFIVLNFIIIFASAFINLFTIYLEFLLHYFRYRSIIELTTYWIWNCYYLRLVNLGATMTMKILPSNLRFHWLA